MARCPGCKVEVTPEDIAKMSHPQREENKITGMCASCFNSLIGGSFSIGGSSGEQAANNSLSQTGVKK